MGDTNVQVILEQLGGGGNAAAAGGQVAGKTLEQVAAGAVHGPSTGIWRRTPEVQPLIPNYDIS